MTDVSERPPRGRRRDLRADGHAAVDWAADYLERVGELPVLAQVKPGEIRAALPASAPDEPEPFAAVLRDLDEIILPGVTHWQHPRYFAYFATGSSEPAIVAELLAAALNSVSILWRTAPAATELEGVVLDWVAQLLGLPGGWHGHIEDSASTATMAALIAAREATGRDLVLCSEQAHSSVAEGRADDRHAAAQGRGRRPSADARRRSRRPRRGGGDRGDGRHHREHRGRRRRRRSAARAQPRARGCTSTPPTPARRWSAPSSAGRSPGIERADSLVVNAHKWMLTPQDCSLLWSRRPGDLRAAFSLTPEYLRTPDAEDALSISEYGPALGRRFRALKLWAVLRCYGPLRALQAAHPRSTAVGRYARRSFELVASAGGAR